MTSAWEFVAHTHLLKLQRLQNKIHRIFGNFHRLIQTPVLHVAFSTQYLYVLIATFFNRQAEVVRYHEYLSIRYIRQGEATHRNYTRLKLGGGQAYYRPSD
jgi:hypothetical protein